MRCPSSNRDNPDDAKFCVGCRRSFDRRCAKCGAEKPSDATFCEQCGTRLGAKAEPSAAAERARPVRPRGFITICALVTDIQGVHAGRVFSRERNKPRAPTL